MAEDKSGKVSGNDLRKGIEAIFSSVLQKENDAAQEALAACVDDPAIAEAQEALRTHDFGRFRSSILREQGRVVSALIKSVFGDNHRLAFLFEQQGFVGAHIRNLFVDFEGSSCCADKERTVIRALSEYFHTGKPIAFDYDAEYTYMLPEIVLRDQESILAYFDALYGLYHGNPKAYLTEMLRMAKLAQARGAATPGAETNDGN